MSLIQKTKQLITRFLGRIFTAIRLNPWKFARLFTMAFFGFLIYWQLSAISNQLELIHAKTYRTIKNPDYTTNLFGNPISFNGYKIQEVTLMHELENINSNSSRLFDIDRKLGVFDRKLDDLESRISDLNSNVRNLRFK